MRMPRDRVSRSFPMLFMRRTKVASRSPLSLISSVFAADIGDNKGSKFFRDVNPSRSRFRIGSSLANTMAVGVDAAFPGNGAIGGLAVPLVMRYHCPGLVLSKQSQFEWEVECEPSGMEVGEDGRSFNCLILFLKNSEMVWDISNRTVFQIELINLQFTGACLQVVLKVICHQTVETQSCAKLIGNVSACLRHNCRMFLEEKWFSREFRSSSRK